jgi:hypothetical protein
MLADPASALSVELRGSLAALVGRARRRAKRADRRSGHRHGAGHTPGTRLACSSRRAAAGDEPGLGPTLSTAAPDRRIGARADRATVMRW